MTPFQYGYTVAETLEKQAGGMAGFGKALGSAIGGAAKAAPAKPITKTLPVVSPRMAQTAAAAGTGAAAASQTPAGQNATQAAVNTVATVPDAVTRAVAAFHNNPVGHQLAHGWHAYEKAVEPFDRAGMSSVVEFPMQMAEGAHRLSESGHGLMHSGMAGR